MAMLPDSVRRVVSWCACSIAFLLLAVSTFAQYRAGIQGSVLDPQGDTITAATVTLTNKETGRVVTVTTDASGVFNFLSLAPGHYSISASATGFKKKDLADVTVSAEQIQSVNVTMEVGDVSQSVTVNGDVTPPIDTETGQISGTLDSKDIQNLPSIGRDPFQLLRLAPGVFGDAAHSNNGGSQNTPGSAGPGGPSVSASIFQTENQVQINANGQRNTTNDYQIDGVEVNSLAWGGAAVITPNEESVKEVRVTSNSYSAENGRNSGAQVEVVSQNGTNEYHGSLFLKMDRPGLNAYQRYNGPGGSAADQRVANRFNQFGGSVGGPIIKNHLFVFFSYETLRNNAMNTNNTWAETPQFLGEGPTGSIASSLLTFPGEGTAISHIIPMTCAQAGLPNPGSCAEVGAGGSQGLDIGSPIKGGLGTHDPTFGAAASPFGVGGGLDGIPDIAFVQTINPSISTATQYNGRVDWQATGKDLIAFSMYYVPNDTQSFNGNARPANLWNSDRLNESGAVLWDHTFSPTLLNEARFNVTRWYFNELSTNPQEPFGLPTDNINLFGNVPLDQISFGAPGPGVFYQTTYNVRDTLTKIWGNHSMKYGVDIYKEQDIDVQAGSARPTYQFNNLWDFANDAPQEEIGNFNPITGQPTDARKYIRSDIYAGFIQDDFKVKPNLTLNIGLRWEYFGPVSEKDGNISNPILGAAPNQLTDLVLKTGGNLYNSSKNNWGPQFGFAWSPGKLPLVKQDMHNRLVIRGGAGIGYNRMEEAVTLNGRSNPPFVSGLSAFGSNILYAIPGDPHQFDNWPSNPAAILTFDPTTNLPTGASGLQIQGVQNNLPTPVTYRYSLLTQYDMGHDWIVTVGYQGSLSRHYTRQQLENLYFPLNPAIATFDFFTNDVNGSYNALLTEVQHRFSKQFEIDAQYTFARAEDNQSQDFEEGTYPFSQRSEWGLADYDVKHNFKLWGVWTPKIFHGEHAWLDKIAGGWTVTGILNAHTGFPFTPVYNVQVADATGATTCGLVYANSGYCTVRPAAYLGGALSDYSNAGFIRDGGNFPNGPTTYFAAPTITGDMPSAPGVARNSFWGPRYSSVDMTLGKAFGLPRLPVLGENAKIDLRANFYNIFNQTNFVPFSNSQETIGTINYNAVTGAQSVTSPNATFGQGLTALAGRVIELQARFSF
ncbi:MAG TPA: TonB-dependent receptor [Candidatus Sulfotelmatobacter sp.]|nr:TonB-dependent receptor [Candidatus Sulfotelmatobacter sp.]